MGNQVIQNWGPVFRSRALSVSWDNRNPAISFIHTHTHPHFMGRNNKTFSFIKLSKAMYIPQICRAFSLNRWRKSMNSKMKQNKTHKHHGRPSQPASQVYMVLQVTRSPSLPSSCRKCGVYQCKQLNKQHLIVSWRVVRL